MSEERHTVIQVEDLAPAFNGAILAPDTGWRQGPHNSKFSLLVTNLRVGRFAPRHLGRTRNKHSRYKVYCDGPVGAGDRIQVRGSLRAEDNVGPLDPLRLADVPLTQSYNDAAVLELGPYDDVCVWHTGDGTLATLHLVGYDLDEDQLDRRDVALLAAQTIAGTTSVPPSQLAVAAAGPLDSWSGDRFFEVSLATYDGITLPTTGSIGVGQRAIFTNVGSPDGFFVMVASPATEKLDGVFGVVAGIIKVLTSALIGDVLVLERIGSNEWKSVDNKTELHLPVITSALVTITYTQGWRGERYLRCTNATPAVNLPPFADTPQGCKLHVRGTVAAVTVQSTIAGQLIIGKGATGLSVVAPDVNTWITVQFNGSEWAHI